MEPLQPGQKANGKKAQIVLGDVLNFIALLIRLFGYDRRLYGTQKAAPQVDAAF
ncbi:hypothetical protein [Azospirillum sp.]|uniref:hypothetical protein n=1 Tax=Azospirillum sp. TaxID=34012 RepID=UPI002D53BCC7|nr:hypothetical protein [Azospirillum sp.]HYD67489.1 hypothetical protein [Azospirillum sp.]